MAMITGEQVRAAQAFLGWTRKEISKLSGVSERTVQRIAEANGIPNASGVNIHKVQCVLEENGITFLNNGATSEGQGVSYIPVE